MLIEIDESVADAVHDGDPNAVDGAENLATVRREGKHVLYATRSVLRSLEDCEHLSARARSVFGRIRGAITQKKGLLDLAKRRLRVLAGPSVVAERVQHEGDKNVHVVHVSRLADTEFLQRPVLLTENLLDASVYHSIASSLRTGGMRVGIELEYENGGGSTTAESYARYVNRARRICLCIVDSDRWSPQGALGQTAGQVMRRGTEAWAWYVVLTARELENVMPLPVLAEALRGHVRAGTVVSVLERVSGTGAAEVVDFLDLKKGVTLRSILNRSTSDRHWWLERIRHTTHWERPLHRDCLQDETCREGSADCECVLLAGFGDALLERCGKAMQETSPAKLREGLCARTQEVWHEVGLEVLSAGMAARGFAT